MNNDFGELHIGTKVYHTYCCGHCSGVVVMNPERKRERVSCYACQRWLCETNELCRVQCTPIHALARDRFEAPDSWTKLVPAIMGGCQTVAEAEEKGLILG